MRFARGRRPNPGGKATSKLEAEYGKHLEIMKRAGEIVDYKHQPLKLRLADLTYYSPDYAVLHNDDSMAFVEVKSYWEDDARVKIKVAAEQFPWFRFVAAERRRKADPWTLKEFS